jgi:soluble lytic murein transglycosylase-like protein
MKCEAIIYFLLLWVVYIMVALALLEHAESAEPCLRTQAAALKAAKKHRVDPALVLAIMKVESNFNPDARGSVGEVGLMQLHPRFHAVYPGEIERNIDTGVAYLARLKTLCKKDYGDAWFVCYNTGANRRIKAPYQFPYYKKVQEAKREVAPYVVGK